MSKVSRKISAALLVFTMLFAFCITPPVLAAEPTTFTENNIKYKVTDSANHYVEVVNPSYTKDPFYNPPTSTYSGDITIPQTVNHNGQNYAVKGLGYAAFIDADITSISLPSGLEYIESAALANTDLTTVTIPATVTRLGSSTSVFGNSAGTPNTTLTTISFENGSQLQALKGYTFAYCTALTNLEIPSGVTTVDSKIFSNCSALETVELPAGITQNVGNALEGYPNAKNVTFAEGSPYANENGVLYKDTLLEKQLDKDLTSVTVREGTTEIADKAFMNSNIATVILPDSVTKIGAGAFCNTKITTIDLSQVTAIEQEAFKNCTALATVQWPTNITELELATFQNCTSLTTVDLPDTLTTLGNSTFEGCSALTTVELPTSLTTLDENVFAWCSSIKEITIPGSISEISYAAFAGCTGLESITLSEGTTKIGDYAFYLLDENDENSNPKLAAINIPASVTNVGEQFLAGVQADGKTALIFEGAQPPTFVNGALAGISGDSANKPTVYYPAEAEDAYTNGDLVTSGLVTKPSEDNPPDTQYALAITEESLSLKEGDTKALTVEKTVPNGATLDWASSNNDVATVQDGTVTAVKEGTATISANMVLNGVTLATDTCTVTVSPKSSTGGGGTVVTTYGITVDAAEGGSVDASHKRAAKNATVTLTATPDEGYSVEAITVTEKDGDKVAVTAKGNGKYTFTMPASDVTVKATFKAVPTEPEQPSELPFTDVNENDWFYGPVEYVFANGIMNGTGDGTTFSPNVPLNRAMMAAVLYNMEGGPAVDNDGAFTDVPNGEWYTDAVNWAASEGIVGGIGGGLYAPNANLTREQMASVLYRYAQYKGIDVSKRADLATFIDGTTVSPWATEVVQWAVAEKLINGAAGNTLQPQGTATRAQVATVLMNLCENVAK